MGKPWRGVAGLTLVASYLLGAAAPAAGAATAPSTALAYVASGKVFVLETLGTQSTITQVGIGQDPVWSPDGAHLLYIVPDFLTNSADIYLADAHGGNSHKVQSRAYPFVAPTWSPDSQYVVYTTIVSPVSTSVAKPASVTLSVRALHLADGTLRTLGQVGIAGGCGTTGTALQTATTGAQGAYRGTPSTLIWAQPDLVAVQASCTGHGLLTFKPGSSKATSLKNWSAGVLSPDGKTIAAVVSPNSGGPQQAQVGLLTVATGKTEVLAPKLGAAAVIWEAGGKVLIVASQPADPAKGSARLSGLSLDGKQTTSVGQIPAAGVYHLSVDPTGSTLAIATVANSAPNAPAPPAVKVSIFALGSREPRTLVPAAGQPAWRPTLPKPNKP